MASWGVPWWGEIMIGFSIGVPVQGLELFIPAPCFRSIVEVVLESFDLFIFYEQLLYEPTVGNKYMIYSGQALFSIIIEFP